jgi:hypothetical protein
LDPLSALIWNLKRLQHVNAVSLAEQKKLTNISIEIISQHRGMSIKQPHPFTIECAISIIYEI